MWSLDAGAYTENIPSRAFAIDGKIYTTIQISEITSQLTF